MLEVAGMRLRLRDTGPKGAPALIMLHGFGSSLETWEPWARALQTDYPAMIARMEQTVRRDPEPLLRPIRAPVLLVWGEKDAMIPFANAADYARVLPESTLASFPQLGHVPQEESPEQSLVPVRAFLGRR
jgi:pimeloyl-ACP methyl ester carboxylesterase